MFWLEKDTFPVYMTSSMKMVKVSAFTVAGLIGSLKVTEMEVWGSTPVAPLGGLMPTTEGGVLSVVSAVVKLLVKRVPTPPLPTIRLPAMSVTFVERATLTKEFGKKLEEGTKVATVFCWLKLMLPETGVPLLVTMIVEELRFAGFIGSEKIKTIFVFIGTPAA